MENQIFNDKAKEKIEELGRSEVLNKTKTLLNEWEDICNKDSIDTKLLLQNKLAIWSCYLASELAEMNLNYNMAYVARKFQLAKDKCNFRMSGLGVGASEDEAETKNQENREKEMNLLYYFDLHKNILSQVNRVLQTMQQQISYDKSQQSNS